MKIVETEFKGLYLIKTHFIKDERGIFNKVYNLDLYKNFNLNTNFEEFFYSESQKDVIRGMHFQIPPYAHEKLIFVVKGCITDVVLDIRKNSKSFGKFFEITMDSNEGIALYISKGYAHGFKSLTNDTIICYLTTRVYNSNYDAGIKFDSFGYDWNIKEPIISEKDRNLVSFDRFESPF